MAVAFGQWGFVAGEISPGLFGKVDLAKFHVAASTMRNMFVSYRTGAYSRAGTAFVGFSKQTGREVPPRLVTFQFSINQGLCLEFGNFYMRVTSNGAFVTEDPIAITGATNADPVQLAIVNDWAVGDWVFVDGVEGMTQINGRTGVIVADDTANIALVDVYGQGIDSTAWGAYTGGGTAARIYTLPTPYSEDDLKYLKFTQSADVMTLVCWNQETGVEYPPQDLSRFADNNWTLAQTTFQVSIQPPPIRGISSVGSGSDILWEFQYVITAVSFATGEESVASAIATLNNTANPALVANTITVTWSPVLGANSYNVYRAAPAISTNYDPTTTPVPVGSLFGYVGSALGTQFSDSNIVADMSTVPPLHDDPFAPGSIVDVHVTGIGGGYNQTSVGVIINTTTGSGAVLTPIVSDGTVISFVVENGGQNYAPGDTITIIGGSGATADLVLGPQSGTYPSCVSYFQERRVYASSPNNPDTYWMSQPGAFKNFDSRIPTISSDAITGTPWSVEVNGIQFMVSMPGGLVVLTGLSAWQLTGAGGSSLNPQPITPANQQAQPQAYNGCSATVPPIKIDYDILYLQAKGSIFRDLAYNFFTNIYTGADLTQLSSQLFAGFTMKEWAWCEEPLKVAWVVRDDGALLSLTFLKTEQVQGWARHDTNGLFQSVCSVTEPPVDALYACVQRFPGGKSAYMIERMNDRIWDNVESCWCVDAGLSLPLPEPQATLTADSQYGIGSLIGVFDLVGGSGYSASTIATVVDDNGQGPGSGAVPVLTISAGVITAVSFSPEGTGYVNPSLVFRDPANSGSGASASPVLDTDAMFTANAAVFGPGSFGSTIRMGGGKAFIVQVIDAEHVRASILEPITSVIPNSGGIVAPQPPGSWTLAPNVTNIAGLDYLNGSIVTGLADGDVIPPTLVVDGQIALTRAASAVTVGLGYQCQLQSVYFDTGGNPTLQGQRKTISACTARVEASRGVKMGINQVDGSTLSPPQLTVTWRNMDTVPDGAAPAYTSNVVPLYTGDQRIPVKSTGSIIPGQVALQQDNPLPMQILALVVEVDEGDLPQPPGPAAARAPGTGGQFAARPSI